MSLVIGGLSDYSWLLFTAVFVMYSVIFSFKGLRDVLRSCFAFGCADLGFSVLLRMTDCKSGLYAPSPAAGGGRNASRDKDSSF
jgi:hypothetical protein